MDEEAVVAWIMSAFDRVERVGAVRHRTSHKTV
jgi:hypothetical protein